MRFQPVKCNMMQLTRKRIKKIYASYTLEGTDLENVESINKVTISRKGRMAVEIVSRVSLINLHENDEVRLELTTPVFAVRRAADCSSVPGAG